MVKSDNLYMICLKILVMVKIQDFILGLQNDECRKFITKVCDRKIVEDKENSEPV